MAYALRLWNSAGIPAWLGMLVAPGVAMADPAPAPVPDPGPPPPVVGSVPDKSGDTLFNPTPADATRGFSTDRPTKAYLPYTVDAGHVQVETDLAVYGVGHQAGSTVRAWTWLDPTVKLGLTSTIEIAVQATAQQTVIVQTGPQRASASGWGDTFVRLKANLVGDDGGKLAIALLPYVKVPTARAALGNGAVEAGLIVPVSIAVPYGFTIVMSPEIDDLHNAQTGRSYRSANMLINVSHPLGKIWTLYAELFATRSLARGDKPIDTFDTALSVTLTPRLQWDIGGNFKLNGMVPATQVYSGLSRRF